MPARSLPTQAGVVAAVTVVAAQAAIPPATATPQTIDHLPLKLPPRTMGCLRRRPRLASQPARPAPGGQVRLVLRRRRLELLQPAVHLGGDPLELLEHVVSAAAHVLTRRFQLPKQLVHLVDPLVDLPAAGDLGDRLL